MSPHQTGIQSGLLFLLLCGISCTCGQAQDVAADTAVELGQESLKSRRYPWYDSKADQLRRTTLPIKKQPRVARDWNYTAPQAGPTNLNWLWRSIQYIVWALLAALFAYLLFLAIKSMVGINTKSHQYAFDEDTRTEADRIENLPFQVERPKGNLLGDAQRLYDAGNYSEAIIYLFSHQLVQLDQAHLIRLTKGKTNRQYMSELRPRIALRAILNETMLAFEDVFFGHYSLSKERFETCWNQLDTFDRELQVQRESQANSVAPGVAT